AQGSGIRGRGAGGRKGQQWRPPAPGAFQWHSAASGRPKRQKTCGVSQPGSDCPRSCRIARQL
ncbi:hypothetical protein GGH99_003815, partial [Coemansia sp. RSA 1285]